MHSADTLTIIEEALESERREVAFFKRLSERIKSPLGKAVFRDYADKGTLHYQNLKELHKQLSSKGKTADQVRVVEVSLVDHDDYEEKISGSIGKALADFDDLTAIDIAARFVRKTTRFLSRSYEALKDPAGKEMLKEIALSEQENFIHLKNIEEYLKDPQAWFREVEHHGLDGA
jgi:rubrerythrin